MRKAVVSFAALTAAALLAGCGSSGPEQPRGLGPATTYDCGGLELETRPIDRDLLVSVSERVYRLSPSLAASGAKYSGGTSTAPVVFWNKGEEATFSIGWRSLPTCRQVAGAAADAGDSAGEEGDPAGEQEAPASGPAPSLIGPEWQVEEIAGEPLLERSRVTLEFRDDGSLGGFASCNSYRSGFETDGQSLSLDAIAATRKACPGPLMRQERRFLQLLDGASRYEIDADGKLVIEAADGTRLRAGQG